MKIATFKPGENGNGATIKLTATSRRGIATMDLVASTGGQSFTLNADSDGAHFSGTICSRLDQPFEITLAASGETWTESATPNSSVDGSLDGKILSLALRATCVLHPGCRCRYASISHPDTL